MAHIIDSITRKLGRNSARPVLVKVEGLGLDIESLPQEVILNLALHGATQVLGDVAALSKEDQEEFYAGVSVETGEANMIETVRGWIRDKAADIRSGAWVPGQRTVDPIETEMNRLARVKVGEKLRDKAKRAEVFKAFREANAGKFEDSAIVRILTQKYRKANDTELRLQAEVNINGTKDLGDFDLESLV
jgi:hypothetical protein